jgi:RraA family protein
MRNYRYVEKVFGLYAFGQVTRLSQFSPEPFMDDLGFRILPRKATLSPELVAEFQTVVTPHISDNMHRASGVLGLQAYHRTRKLVGTAFTVKTRPGDNLMIHKALELIQAGDVLVVDAGGDTTNALVGELMMMMAQKKGVAGFVLDGAVRDVAAFHAADFPCWARAVTHRGPYKDGPGEINVPVSIGGTVVSPGDLVVADEDGIVTVPAERVEAVLGLARRQADKEESIKLAINAGTYDKSWVDALLKAKGVAA